MRAREFSDTKLVIFDIDDTLVNTDTKVGVVRDGKVIKKLNSHEFTHYKLQPGESFDFGAFADAHEFFANARPIVPMIGQLKRDISSGNKVIMVTARADFNDREVFLDTFRKYGVDMEKVHVYRAGNIGLKVPTEEKKKMIIRQVMGQDHYDKVIMYDDAEPNLHAFMSLASEYPWSKFYAWHVDRDGRATEYHRSNITEDPAAGADKIELAALDFYKNQVGDVQAQPVDDFRDQARELLQKAAPGIRDKVLAALKKANANPYIQGGVITTVGAVLAGGILASAQKMGLNSTQTNVLLQAILNTVIPTMVSRVNGKSWRDTLKYTLASAGIGTGIAAMTENTVDEKIEPRTTETGFEDQQPVGNGEYVIKARGHTTTYRERPVNILEIQLLDSKTQERVAYVDFIVKVRFEDKEPYLESMSTWVKPEYRGKGLAKIMYQYANSIGNDIQPSNLQTFMGRDMWKGLTKTVRQLPPLPKPPVKPKPNFWQKFKKSVGVAENFADGKVKGKSRPGRVKRAGASCAGSVTDLRAKARKYGGEKGKMYHWCANMKGGKKK